MSTLFPSATIVLDQDLVSFFAWFPADRLRADSDPEGRAASRLVLAEVASDDVAEYRASVLPPDDSPAPGVYAVYWNHNGPAAVLSYGSDIATALLEVLPLVGEEAGSGVQVIATRIPAHARSTAEADVKVSGGVPRARVVAVALEALGERRDALFGVEVRDANGARLDGPVIHGGIATVRAFRD